MIPVLTILGLYNSYCNNSKDQPPYFDFYVAKLLQSEEDSESWGLFWGHCWDRVNEEKKRPTKWLLDKTEFEKIDSVKIGYRNISNEKVYYVTWGAPNSRMRVNYIIYKNGTADSIPFGGFGCATGIHLAPLHQGESSATRVLNPLLFNLFSGDSLPLKKKGFPKAIREVYGDSVSLIFEQAIYSLPWNKYPSQMINSNEIVISTEKIIED